VFSIRHLPFVGVLLVAMGCATPPAPPRDWVRWQARRAESIGGPTGWTTLVGLHWLIEGENSAGRASINQVVLASAGVPAFVGIFTRKGDAVTFAAAADADVRVQGERVTRVELTTDAQPDPTQLQIGLVSIVAVQRGDRLGLRVRDPDSSARREFKGLRWFPYNPTWRLEGKFLPFTSPEKLRVPDVIGATQEFDSPGVIVFSAQGGEHQLAVAQEPGDSDFFVMFRDETSGKSTYPAGRFLYVSKADAGENVVIDFNRAYTPPCGFTAFATCPLPPQQNWLQLAVKAGELNPTGH
jgi:uncharacterized protein (DUF1684 family)